MCVVQNEYNGLMKHILSNSEHQIVSFLVSCVLDCSSSGVVSSEQAQCWRLFPYGLQCHNTIPNAQGRTQQKAVVVKKDIQHE